MTSVAYCYHVFVHVCICTCCMLRYAISFIGNLTVVLVAHVLVVFGLSWWGSRVSYVSLEGGLGPLFLYDLDITDRSLCMCGRVQLGVSSGLYAYTADLLTLAGRSETPLPALSGWSNIECPMLRMCGGSTWPVLQTGLTATIWYMVSGRASGSVFGMGHLYAAAHRPTCSQLRCILT